MADFMRIKYENPKMKQPEIANHLGYSSSTLKTDRKDMNMLSPYKIRLINSNEPSKNASKTNFNNNLQREPDIERPQTTSNDAKTTQTNTKPNKKKQKCSENGSIHKNTEINDHYLDDISDNNDR